MASATSRRPRVWSCRVPCTICVESIEMTEISEVTYQKEQEAILQRKADQEEVDAIATAIERGLAL